MNTREYTWLWDHSVEWEPFLTLFKHRTIPRPRVLKKLEFSTGSPGVSSSSIFISIHQQKVPFEVLPLTSLGIPIYKK